ncbi:MAG: acyltransferase family protein [Candidatus Wallbacteria bacterium]|nr:acyltransferase family protein [Candidatus Wallbacteria bacterium]
MPRAARNLLHVVPPAAAEVPSPEPAGPDDAFGRDDWFIDKLGTVFEFLYSRWFRVEVTGLENVPRTGRCLLVSNHSGALPWDALMIFHALRTRMKPSRHVRFLIDKFVVRLPFLSMAAARGGFVLACWENARRLLMDDQLVGVFPEGTKGTGKLFRDRYHLARFGRGGFAEVALETGAPILPVSVIGAEETHPILYKADFLARLANVPYVPVTPTFPLLGALGAIPLPSRFHIHFGKPLRFKPGARRRAHDFTVVLALNKAIRARITRQMSELLRRRQSVF